MRKASWTAAPIPPIPGCQNKIAKSNELDPPLLRGVFFAHQSCQSGAPGGNLTGINLMALELTAKRLELLREMLPAAARVAVLVNPANTANAQITLREVEAAGRAMGLQLQIFNASTSREIDAAFAAFGRERPDAVFVGQDAFFVGRRLQIANWAARHALPMTSGRATSARSAD